MADEKKDQTNQTSDKNKNQVLDNDEFMSMVRGEREGDLQERKTEDREPEIKTEGERETHDVKREDRSDKKEDDVDPSTPLGRALASIETLQRSNRDLEERLNKKDTETREPQIELEELVPGVRVPKDRSKWPVNLPKELLEKVGIDPVIQPGLHALANLLFWDISRMVQTSMDKGVDDRLERRQASSNAEKTFFETYSDLEAHRDLAEFTEGRIRADGRHARSNFKDDKEYSNFVATETRRVIARARGVSYDDYMKDVDKNAPRKSADNRDTSNQNRRQSRVISSGTGRRSPGSAESGFEKESRDMM